MIVFWSVQLSAPLPVLLPLPWPLQSLGQLAAVSPFAASQTKSPQTGPDAEPDPLPLPLPLPMPLLPQSAWHCPISLAAQTPSPHVVCVLTAASGSVCPLLLPQLHAPSVAKAIAHRAPRADVSLIAGDCSDRSESINIKVRTPRQIRVGTVAIV